MIFLAGVLLRTFYLGWRNCRLSNFDLLRRVHVMTRQNSFVSFFFDRVVLQHPGAVILCVLAVVSLLAFQTRYFRLDASAETLVLENDEDLRYARQISSRYGQNDFLVLAYTPKGTLFSPDTLSTLARLRDELRLLEHVESVLMSVTTFSPLNMLIRHTGENLKSGPHL